MVRGTFANIRLKNLLVTPREGFWTRHFPDGAEMTIYDAAMQYQREGIACLIIAGREYGSGSSRDWAAKGPKLQGVRAVLAWGSEAEAGYGVRLGLDRADVVKLSLRELEFLSGTHDPASGTQSLWAEGMRLMVVTMGSQGCAYRTAAEFGQIPGQQVDVVDKGGAGEGFMAGLLAELVRSKLSFEKSDIERALSFANAVAALTPTQRGTLLAFPTAEQMSTPHLSS